MKEGKRVQTPCWTAPPGPLNLFNPHPVVEPDKGAFINYDLGGVGKLEGGVIIFWGIPIGGVTFLGIPIGGHYFLGYHFFRVLPWGGHLFLRYCRMGGQFF